MKLNLGRLVWLKVKIKIIILVFAISFFGILSFSSAVLNVQLSDQGTGVVNSTGALQSGDLTVLIYDAASGGNLVYNETFSERIENGSWNVMLGSGVDLPLEFGKVYYKDYLILGEDAHFDGSDRQAFYSPLGDIGGEDINNNSNLTVYNINATGLIYGNGSQLTGVVADSVAPNVKLVGDVNVTSSLWVPNLNVTGNVSIGDRILFSDSLNRSLFANSTSIYYFNGTSYSDLRSDKVGENYWSRDSVNNVTSLLNEQDNVNLTDSNISTEGTGFFGWVGSLTDRVGSLFLRDIDFNGTLSGDGSINLSGGDIITTGNLSVDWVLFDGDVNSSLVGNGSSVYWFNGSDYVDLAVVSDVVSLWEENVSSGDTWLGNLSMRLGVGTDSPSQRLEVNGSLNVSDFVYVSNISSDSLLRLMTSGVTRVYVNDSTGYVGIGDFATDSFVPVNLLHTYSGATNSVVKFESKDGNYLSDVYISERQASGNSMGARLRYGDDNKFEVQLGTDSVNDNYVSRLILNRDNDGIELNGSVEVEENLNMTSNNITAVDCVVFNSGGRICNSA